MAYTFTHSLNLGVGQTGIASNLRAQLVDSSGTSVGSAVSTGFTEVGVSGNYIWTYAAFPDDHRGGVKFYNSGAPTVFLAFLPINPEEGEYTNSKASTNVTTITAAITAAITSTATAVWASGTRTLSSFGTLVADIWASVTRTITGGTVSTVSDKTGYSLSATQAYNNTAQTSLVPVQVYGIQEAAITATSIATDAIGGPEIAASAVTKIQSGLALTAAFTTPHATIAKIETMLQADAPNYQFTAAALEQGAGSTGDGDTAVDHNTGGSMNLAVLDWGGNGIDGATIRAYLTSEYAVSATTAPIRGTTRTTSTGAWLAPLLLDSGATYTLVVTASDGDLLPGTQSVVVP